MDLPKLDRVKVDVVDRWCAHYKLELRSTATLDRKVFALSEAMKSAQVISGCDTCGGDSDGSLPDCPFCGTGDDPPAVNPKQEEDATMAAKKAKKTANAKKAAVKKPAPKPAPAKKAAAKPAKEKPAKKASKKAEGDSFSRAAKKIADKAAAEPARPKSRLSAKAPAAADAPTPSTKPVKAKLELTIPPALMTAMGKVRALQKKGVETIWELGHELYQLYTSKDYAKIKRGEKAAYDSWSAFVKAEFGMGSDYSIKLMDVASNFDKEKLLAVGVTKLSMILRVPSPEKRNELVEKAATATRDELGAEVKNLTKGQPPRDTGRKGFKGTPGTGRKASVSSKLTVVRNEPRVVVQLFKRGSTERAFDLEDAVGVEDCANGVKLYYALAMTEEGLELAVETRREG